MQATTGPNASEESGRRSVDRRVAQVPFDGVDKRKRERRSGNDRRASPRISAE
ncbi:MAG: hypothetical protein JY451_09550 [Erythrobacter sp.]|nr:MAG: hypothetical protein JY451_09550 [Erythrobacter sp.]